MSLPSTSLSFWLVDFIAAAEVSATAEEQFRFVCGGHLSKPVDMRFGQPAGVDAALKRQRWHHVFGEAGVSHQPSGGSAAVLRYEACERRLEMRLPAHCHSPRFSLPVLACGMGARRRQPLRHLPADRPDVTLHHWLSAAYNSLRKARPVRTSCHAVDSLAPASQ